MTGTINPDGTAGPVGGISQKMEGAKRQGLTRFGYPIGVRTSQDMRTGQTVDLQDWGRRLGLEEVREIRDLWDAYEFLTGETLERAEPLADTGMELDSNLRIQLNAKF